MVLRGLLPVLPTVEAQSSCFVALERARQMALRVFAIVRVFQDPFLVCAYIMHAFGIVESRFATHLHCDYR